MRQTLLPEYAHLTHSEVTHNFSIPPKQQKFQESLRSHCKDQQQLSELHHRRVHQQPLKCLSVSLSFKLNWTFYRSYDTYRPKISE